MISRSCPVPAGPYLDETERRVQAHSRAERGTTCWLSGQCDRPNFYAYDKDIAEALRVALRQRNPFADSTLWVTVQGRIVYFEGCVVDERIAPDLEAFARSAPNVQQAVALVFANPAVPPPDKLLSAP